MNNETQTYNVTRQFIGGNLKGLTHTGMTTVSLPVGFRCDQPCGGSPYIVVACEKVAR